MRLAEYGSAPGWGWQSRAHRGLTYTPQLARAERARPPSPQRGWREGCRPVAARSLRRYASRGDTARLEARSRLPAPARGPYRTPRDSLEGEGSPSGERLVADAVGRVGLSADTLLPVGLVVLVVALEPDHRAVAFEGQHVRG